MACDHYCPCYFCGDAITYCSSPDCARATAAKRDTACTCEVVNVSTWGEALFMRGRNDPACPLHGRPAAPTGGPPPPVPVESSAPVAAPHTPGRWSRWGEFEDRGCSCSVNEPEPCPPCAAFQASFNSTTTEERPRVRVLAAVRDAIRDWWTARRG